MAETNLRQVVTYGLICCLKKNRNKFDNNPLINTINCINKTHKQLRISQMWGRLPY